MLLKLCVTIWPWKYFRFSIKAWTLQNIFHISKSMIKYRAVLAPLSLTCNFLHKSFSGNLTHTFFPSQPKKGKNNLSCKLLQNYYTMCFSSWRFKSRTNTNCQTNPDTYHEWRHQTLRCNVSCLLILKKVNKRSETKLDQISIFWSVLTTADIAFDTNIVLTLSFKLTLFPGFEWIFERLISKCW